MFFFISPLYLRAPSADRRETLLHDRKLAEFYNAVTQIQKFEGGGAKKMGGGGGIMRNFG